MSTSETSADVALLERAVEGYQKLRERISRVIVGQQDISVRCWRLP